MSTQLDGMIRSIILSVQIMRVKDGVSAELSFRHCKIIRYHRWIFPIWTAVYVERKVSRSDTHVLNDEYGMDNDEIHISVETLPWDLSVTFHDIVWFFCRDANVYNIPMHVRFSFVDLSPSWMSYVDRWKISSNLVYFFRKLRTILPKYKGFETCYSLFKIIWRMI